jgi:Fe-S cluster biogenesis protein NfuA
MNDNNDNNIRQRVLEVLHNVNWLLEAHDSFAELVEIKGNKVIIRCVGYCAECETNCVSIAFKERMPDIELILQ